MKSMCIVIGSPRRNGNTVFLSNRLLDLLDGNVASDTAFLYDRDIRPCTDCRACKRGDRVCAVNDDMQEMYARLEESDILVIGTPIYWYAPTAQTKLFIDRLRPYYANKKLVGKRAALLLPAGSGRTDCDLTEDMFRRIFAALGIEYLGAAAAKA